MNTIAVIALLGIGAIWGALITFVACAVYSSLKTTEGAELPGFPFDPSSKHPHREEEKGRAA